MNEDILGDEKRDLAENIFGSDSPLLDKSDDCPWTDSSDQDPEDEDEEDANESEDNNDDIIEDNSRDLFENSDADDMGNFGAERTTHDNTDAIISLTDVDDDVDDYREESLSEILRQGVELARDGGENHYDDLRDVAVKVFEHWNFDQSSPMNSAELDKIKTIQSTIKSLRLKSTQKKHQESYSKVHNQPQSNVEPGPGTSHTDNRIQDQNPNFDVHWSDDDDDDELLCSDFTRNTSLMNKQTNRVNDHHESGDNDNFVSGARNDGTDPVLCSEKFPHSVKTRRLMKEKFGIKSYRTNQLQAINSALLGHDTFVLMPTGGGKSLCYQLPAVVSGGVSVVISPLVSLIHDQVSKLTSLGIRAEQLTGDDQERHNRVFQTLRAADTDLPTLLYLTPERLANSQKTSDILTSLHNRNKLTRFIIDEVTLNLQGVHVNYYMDNYF